MAEDKDGAPVRIVEQSGENAILIIPGKMVKWVWYETKFDNKELMICMTGDFEILVKKKK